MPGPSERPPSGVLLEHFDGSQHEPFTVAEIASNTSCSLETVEEGLEALVDRGLLQTKQVADSEPVWWSPLREIKEGERSKTVGTAADAAESRDSRAARQRLLDQHRQLAEFVTRINVADDLDEILQLITEEARDLVGAHQSVTSRTVNQNWEQAINAVSLSDKYAEYREYDTPPDGSGIYALACERNEPMRMTQAELESHPAWKAFGDEGEEHPPMRGWLAVPIVGPDGENMGLIQLSDTYHGEFTEADEAILIQLANVASAAIENARLYDELRESEERYRTLFDSMTEGYCVIEQVDTPPEKPIDFRYVEANEAFENHVGLHDVAGKTIREVVPSEPQEWIDTYESVARTGEEVAFEREIGPQGRVLQCQAFPIGDVPDGRVGMTVRDVTDRVERERRLEESNERLEQFAHAASHDMQEPLRMVSSYLQLLEDRYDNTLDKEGMEFLNYAVDGADRMREMINGLLEYSRVERQGNPLEPIDLGAVLEDACDDLQIKIEENDAEITAEELPRVAGDASQLRQVFQNLLDNAIEYSGDDPPRVHVAAERDGSEWILSVRDEGIGIDPKYSDSIFQVFERLYANDEHSGTGIGLALCERIVERHGGEIWVESEPGEGSTFHFMLPATGE